MPCSSTISNFFAVNLVLGQECVLALTHFNNYMNHLLSRMSEISDSGVSLETVLITALDFADNTVIIAGTTEALAEALESLSEKAAPLGLCDCWTKIQVHGFGGVFNASVESIGASGATHHQRWQRAWSAVNSHRYADQAMAFLGDFNPPVTVNRCIRKHYSNSFVLTMGRLIAPTN